MQKKVLSFGPNCKVEVRPNCLAEPNIRSVTTLKSWLNIWLIVSQLFRMLPHVGGSIRLVILVIGWLHTQAQQTEVNFFAVCWKVIVGPLISVKKCNALWLYFYKVFLKMSFGPIPAFQKFYPSQVIIAWLYTVLFWFVEIATHSCKSSVFFFIFDVGLDFEPIFSARKWDVN